jgi:DNA-directed RNA polymerase specialized sigma24 family protein
MLEWLDEGADSRGEKYLEMRRRLVWFFARKRCLDPDALADETLNRVARRLDEEGGITDATPAHYCYIVAKYVLLEQFRNPDHRPIGPAGDVSSVAVSSASQPDVDAQGRERVLQCLDRCLGQLTSDDRTLILEYYRGSERIKIDNRRGLATRLGITPNALSIRACRIRNRLERCVKDCRALRRTDRFPRVSSYQE